ncbi:uncharacterized protein LOC123523650 [Mercenaria mercenaria]|uniref:uncharacterized protein LOC123523650 n=1 Tax=Mercenaria mercenaria TaxID=6596 RepID=UPI00234F1A6E|nr:uncharacterized protein LOC123523650 [Mercenaria mercenaria]
MSCAKDVDDTILGQAMSLLPYVRANGHRDTTVDSLSDVPWLLVLVFELLTTETLPEEMKPFHSFQEQVHTLQMILDTLEQTLRLPMNHITGMGLARLERRPLSDALQIFSDLIKHCFSATTKETSDRGVLETPEGRRLSLSQFGSPEFGVVSFSQFSTPEMSVISRDGAICLPDKQPKMGRYCSLS